MVICTSDIQGNLFGFRPGDEFGGKTNLRFDDTSVQGRDGVRRFHHGGREVARLRVDGLFYASIIRSLYEWQCCSSKAQAYVDDLSADEIRQYRGP